MTLSDALAMSIALIILGLSYALFWQNAGPARQATIQGPGDTAQVVHLDHKESLHVAGPLGDSVLQIDRGQIRFVASPCSNKYCVHAGWLKHSGRIMACLPNGVLVEVQGGPQRYDAINF